jgi:hypothetical protein
LKNHGITKCYVSEGFDFEAKLPNGEIYVNAKDMSVLNDLYAVFTEDGFVDEEQNLFIWYNDRDYPENFTV